MIFFEWQIFVAFLTGSIGTIIAGRILLRRWIRGQREAGRQLILIARKDAEVTAREIHARAKEEFEQLRFEEEERLRRRESALQAMEKELGMNQRAYAHEMESLREREEKLGQMRIDLNERKEQIDSLAVLYRQQMQRLANMSDDEIRECLLEELKKDCSAELEQWREQLLGDGEENIREEARRILVDTVQRLSSAPPEGLGATIVKLPSEDMKGRIIGREGRNIRSFELATGTTLMIDESPDTVLISSFDPVRREAAKMALEELMEDGRIHPVSIEEAVNRALEELRSEVIQLGEKAVSTLKLSHVHPDLLELLGKLHYRLSNNQNTLDHSIEVAFLAGMLASEIGIDPEPAKRAGLFHDCGKAIEEAYEGSHAQAGARLLKQYGEDERVVNAVAAHHEEVAAQSVYAGLLMTADRLSATRPGARSDSLEGYIKRVQSLEAIAKSIPEVIDAYAVQAGREVRVVVSPEKMDDAAAKTLARVIRRRVEDELQYPGTIRITVIRESRFSEMAK